MNLIAHYNYNLVLSVLEVVRCLASSLLSCEVPLLCVDALEHLRLLDECFSPLVSTPPALCPVGRSLSGAVLVKSVLAASPRGEGHRLDLRLYVVLWEDWFWCAIHKLQYQWHFQRGVDRHLYPMQVLCHCSLYR